MDIHVLCVPENPFGKHTKSHLQLDPEFAQDILTHLLSCGKYVTSQDIVDYLARPNVQQKYNLKHTVSSATAKCWMHKLGYQFVKNHVGQYVNGHECDNVDEYCQLDQMHSWSHNDLMEYGQCSGCQVITWFHNESIFYAHDHEKSMWLQHDQSATPYAKGEGISPMVADLNCDGYIDNDNILGQAEEAIDILLSDYPDEDHVLIFDNATTHLKHAPDTPSASKMTKSPSHFGIEVPEKGLDGKTLYDPSGKPQKKEICMSNGQLPNGTPHSFYFPPRHAQEGMFKGMVTILAEHGYGDWSKVRFECKKFKCNPAQEGNCCCHWKLYNELDFVNGKSLLERACKACGFQCLFLLKFHCEPNPIKQCWGHAKYYYCLTPASKKEEDLLHNMLDSLDWITIQVIWCFACQAHCFIDGYKKGLDGKMAAWATRKYQGHWILQEGIMKEFLDQVAPV
ncbi:hypothetical protein GGU11DRAFT_819019 [Lentinula aff. detonsa]|nr:hypothetical protein GGU11DRAFT_819019 [Lentinula aff. detonsa]